MLCLARLLFPFGFVARCSFLGFCVSFLFVPRSTLLQPLPFIAFYSCKTLQALPHQPPKLAFDMVPKQTNTTST